MPSYFLWIMLIGMLLMMWFVSRRQRAMQEALWSKRAIAAIEEPPCGSAGAHEDSEGDVEQADDEALEPEQDATDPRS